jgi:hypothetical protein
MQDELYLAEVFTDDGRAADDLRCRLYARSLLVGGSGGTGQMFCRDGWDHPPGSSLIGWTKMAINSRLAYLQPGDGVAPDNAALPAAGGKRDALGGGQ